MTDIIETDSGAMLSVDQGKWFIGDKEISEQEAFEAWFNHAAPTEIIGIAPETGRKGASMALLAADTVIRERKTPTPNELHNHEERNTTN